MQSRPLQDLKPHGERHAWHRQYVRNAIAALGQISTKDPILAGHLMRAEKALREAAEHLTLESTR